MGRGASRFLDSSRLPPGRQAYVQVARGSVTVNGCALQAGDAVQVTDEAVVGLSAAKDAEVLLFDLA